MIRNVTAVLIITFSFFLFWSCEPTQEEAELTLRDAMQSRMTEMVRIKVLIENGEPIPESEIIRFKGLPNSEFVDDVSEYQDAFDSFDEFYTALHTSENPARHFNIIVQTCASCHQNVCPGPLRFIERLEIEES